MDLHDYSEEKQMTEEKTDLEKALEFMRERPKPTADDFIVAFHRFGPEITRQAAEIITAEEKAKS